MASELDPLPKATADAAATTNTSNPTDLQDRGMGVQTEWLFDHRVTAIYLTEMTVATVDTWVDYMKSVLRDWPAGQMYCALTDLSAPNVRMTPYARTRAAESTTMRNELTTFAAVVLAPNVFGQVLRPFINSFPHPNSATIKIFFSRAEALTWLEKMLNKYGSKPA
jgi:hypothetical protein